jgi:hypothetical protein
MSGPVVALPVSGGVVAQSNYEAMMQGVVDRTIRAPGAEAPLQPLPAIADRANKPLAFNGAGQPVALAGVIDPEEVVVSTFGETLVGAADAATARTTLGAAGDTFTQTGAGAVARAVDAKLRDVIHPAEFDILPGNDDNAAGFAALAAELNARGGGVVIFPPGQTYDVFDDAFTSGVSVLMELEDLRGLRIDMNGSKLRSSRNWATDSTVCRMFQLTDCEDVEINFEAEQVTGATTDTFATGHIGVYLINKCRRVRVNGRMYGGRGGVEVVRGSGFSLAAQAENLQITMDCEHVFYPVAFERNGRSAELDIVARAAGRSLYLANAVNVEAQVWTDNTGLYDDIVITAIGAAGEGTRNNACDNIRLHVTHRPDTAAVTGVFSLVSLVFQQIDIASPTNAARLSNINVTVDADYTGAAAMPNVIVYGACQKDASGTTADAATQHTLLNIRVGGNVIGMTGSNPIVDLFRTGSPALVGSAVVGGITLENLYVAGVGTPAFFIQRDIIDFNLTLRNVYAPGSSITWAGTLPEGILDASQGVNLSNLKSVAAGSRLMPAGRVKRWGVATGVAPSSNATVDFPVAFSATPTGAVLQCLTGGTTDVLNAAVSTTQLTINRPGGSSNVDVYWEVEGAL